MKEKWEEYKIIFLIVIMAVTGSTSAFFKIGLRELPIDLFTLLRFFFAFIIFAPYLLKQGAPIIADRKKLIFISLVGTANVLLFIFGLKYTTAIISGMLYAGVPLITSVLALVIIKEKISTRKWLGIFVGFLGVLVITLAPTLNNTTQWNGTPLGNVIILTSVTIFCLYSVLSKKYSNEYPPIVLTKYFILTTIVMQLILLSFHTQSYGLLANLSLATWLAVIYVGVLGTTLYYFLYQYVIKRASPVLASTTFFLQPLAGIMWSWLLLGERITSTFFFGSVFIFLGMGLVFHEQYSKPKNQAQIG